MKTLIATALSALAVGVFAAEAENAAQAAVPPPAQEAAANPQAPRGFDRAKFEERMKQRRLERTKKVVDILVSAGVPAEKAAAAAEEIDSVYVRPPRRPRPPRSPRPPMPRAKPQQQPTAEGAAAPEAK